MKRDGNTLVRDIVFGREHGAFDSDLGQSLLRAYAAGAISENDPLAGMVHDLVRHLRVQDMFGTLPPFRHPRLERGELVLGASNRGPVRYPLGALASGALVAGSTGSGKTTLWKTLAPQIAAQGVRLWMLDPYKQDLRHLRPVFQQAGQDLVIVRGSDWRINPFEPIVKDARTHFTLLVDILSRTLGLSSRARSILGEKCYALYQRFGIWDGRTKAYPCLFDLVEDVRSGKDHPASRDALLSRLTSLLVALTPRCVAYRRAWRVSDLARHSLCIEGRGLSEWAKQVILEPALAGLLHRQVEHGTVNAPLQLLLVTEDSQRFYAAQQDTGGDLSPMSELSGIVRGCGIGIVAMVQTLHGLAPNLVGNLNLKIMGRLGTYRDYVQLGRDLGMTHEQIRWASLHLRPGRFICQVGEGNTREPFVLTVPNINVPASVSDDDATESLAPLAALPVVVPAPEYADWQPVPHLQPSGATAQPEESQGGPVLSKDQLDFLASVARHPFLSVRDRNEHLGLSAWKGNRLKASLEKQDLVRAVTIRPPGRGRRRILLELTKAGRELARAHKIKPQTGNGRGGLAHQWWTQEIKDWLTTQGAHCTIEDDTTGARVDLRAEHRGQTLAIEVELSDGHEGANVRKDLAAGYDYVVSLVPSSRAERRLRKHMNGDLPASVCIGTLQGYRDVLTPLLRLRSAGLQPNKNTEHDPPKQRANQTWEQPPAPVTTQPEPAGAFPTPEAARYLGLSPATLETMRTRGGGPRFVKLGRRVVYRRGDLDQWLAGRVRSSTSDAV